LKRATKSSDTLVARQAYHNLGVLTYWSGDVAQSTEYFEQAVNLDSAYLRGQYSLGIVLHEQEEYQSSLEHFRVYSAGKSQDAQAHFDLGVALVNAVRFDGGNVNLLLEARESFTAVIQLDSKFPHADSNLEIVNRVLA